MEFTNRQWAHTAKYLLTGLLLIGVVGCGTDWKSTAVQDINGMHEILLENHPGVLDEDNPGFRQQLEANHRHSLALAQQVEDQAGYLYALRSFTVPFHDEHLKAGLYISIERKFAWPGFAVTTNAQQEVVVFRRDSEDAPPIGARLVAADGMEVEQLLEERIKPFIGNWELASKRPGDVPYLLIDSNNVFVDRLQTATFEWDGKSKDFELNWRPLSESTRLEIDAQVEPTIENTTRLEVLPNGAVWISIASFNISDPNVNASMQALLAKLESERAALEKAPYLVLDVRGNDGGSQEPGIEIARQIWGETYVESVRPRVDQVRWRASAGNLQALRQILPAIEQGLGADHDLFKKMTQLEVGLAEAIEAGQEYLVIDHPRPASRTSQPRRVPDRIYFLTDSSLVSAGLDFADVVMAMPGVTQVGLETAGDTRYLEVRVEPLPSGKGQLAFPTAIHRGRLRADNQSYKPQHVWNGDITDTQAIAEWISELAADTHRP